MILEFKHISMDTILTKECAGCYIHIYSYIYDYNYA